MMSSDGVKPRVPQLVRPCQPADFEAVYAIINDAAQAYRGVIPPDCWHEPYMPREELAHEIRQGVAFWGLEQAGVLLGVMGLQPVNDVTLIRHAYLTSDRRGEGIGGKLLEHLLQMTAGPILVGTWAAAEWAELCHSVLRRPSSVTTYRCRIKGRCRRPSRPNCAKSFVTREGG